jgi:hypothetical protein
MRNAVGGSIAGATALRLGRIGLRIVALIIVVLIHIHVSSSRFVMLRSLLLWCLRHARQWSRSCHRRKRRRMVSSLRWVITIVEAARIRPLLRALTWHLGRRHAVRGSWTTTVRLFHLLALLFVRRRLCTHVLTFSFPFAVSLNWRSSRRPVVAFTGCLLGSSLGRSWRRSSAGNTTSSRRICMVLVWSLVAVPWRSRPVLDNRAHFRWWAGRANTIGRRSTLARGLSWWAAETSRWRRRWRRDTASVGAVIRVGNTVRLGWLLV